MRRDIHKYQDLVDAIRDRRKAMGLSCEALDDIAGLPDRYTNKLENFGSKNGRHLGEISLPLVLGALQLKLVVTVDKDATPRRPIPTTERHQVTHLRRTAA